MLKIEDFNKNDEIWECACGQGHLSEVFLHNGYRVKSTDLIFRGYGKGNIDFLQFNEKYDGNIITNPPYKYAKEFVEHALNIVNDGNKIALFLKVQFLEGKARKKLFKNNPPKKIWISSSRLLCAKNAKFDEMKAGGGSAVAYAWFIWEKGYKGQTVIDWFN